MLDLDERLEAASRELRAQLDSVAVAPVSAVVHRLHRRRRVGAVAALLAVAGVIGVGVVATRDNAPVASVSTPSSEQSSVTSVAALPSNMTTPNAEAWRSIVQDALHDASWSATLDTVYENVNAPGGAPWVAAVAVVGAGRIVFEVNPFAAGEYQADSVWQMGVAGATSPGTATPEGTRFTFDYPGTPVRGSTIVAPYGMVVVHAEMIPTSTLPDVAVFSSVAAALARGASQQLYSTDPEPASSTSVPMPTTAGAGLVPPVAVGGSVMLAAKAALEAQGFEVDAEVNRGPQEIIVELNALRAAGSIGDTVVIQVGMNGPITDGDLDRIVALLPRSQTPNLVFMTERAPVPWIASNNERINALPARYPWVSVLDWESLSGDISLCSDGIHLSCTSEAVEYYTNAIIDAVKPVGDTQAEP